MRLNATRLGSIASSRSFGDQLDDLAGQVPSLDLNFAQNKSLIDDYSGTTLVTFTRASSGTYVDSDGVIQTAATNAPRFDHNPTTGESLGLLVEEARTNSFEWSNSATQGETWNNVGTALNLASGQSDPAGGTAGIRATDANSVSAGTSLQRTSLANLTASTTVTYSVWLKPIDCPNNLITLIIFANTVTDSINANFSVSGTAITAVSTSANGTGAASGASFEVFPNGWYRCRLTGVPSTVTMADVRARINLGSYQRAAGTARFDWYGAQLESGAFATSYIPTSGTAATRAADVASITGSNFSSWYNQTEGTLYLDSNQASITGTLRMVSANNNTSSNRINLTRTSSSGGNINFVVTNAGTNQVAGLILKNSLVAGTSNKVAAGYKAADFGGSVNGLTPVTQSTGTVPSSLTQLTIANGDTLGVTPVNSTTKRLTYWPVRLSNEVLQRITQ